MIRKVVKILWIFIALISLVCVFIFFSIAKGWIGYMPPVEDLENPNYKFATEVFSEDGKVLGTYSYSKENRVFVGYNDLSPNIINALIATEDVRFAEHSGIDAYALTRAIVKRGILMQKNAGGGSTITQQLSKHKWNDNKYHIPKQLVIPHPAIIYHTDKVHGNNCHRKYRCKKLQKARHMKLICYLAKRK